MAHCRGELVGFLDHDDALAPEALGLVAQAFTEGEIDVLESQMQRRPEALRLVPTDRIASPRGRDGTSSSRA
jgi:hypothetical protein